MPVIEPIDRSETAAAWVFRYTEPFRMSRLAGITSLLLALSAIGLIVLNLWTVHMFRNWRPLVYRVEGHHITAEAYDRAAERWSKDDARMVLEDFVHYYYERNRQTVGDVQYGFPRSLLFLSNDLATKAKTHKDVVFHGGCENGAGDSCTVATYLSDGLAPDISIRIVKSEIYDFKGSGEGQWQGVVTFWQDLHRSYGESKSILSTLTVQAELMERVPDDDQPSNRNPVGLLIEQIQLSEGYGQ